MACVALIGAMAVTGFVQVNNKAQAFEAAVDAQRDREAAYACEVPYIAPEPEKPVLYDVPLSEYVQMHLISTCESYDIDPEIVLAMIERESQFTADIVGDNGQSFGLLQIQPRWHYQRMSDLGCTDLLNAEQNITVAVDILAEQVERYDGDISAALVAYNQGSYKGTVTAYALDVLEKAENCVKVEQ